MTNYEILFKKYMKDTEFKKAYYEVRAERYFSELLEDLKEKINQDAPKNILLKTIEKIQKQVAI